MLFLYIYIIIFRLTLTWMYLLAYYVTFSLAIRDSFAVEKKIFTIFKTRDISVGNFFILFFSYFHLNKNNFSHQNFREKKLKCDMMTWISRYISFELSYEIIFFLIELLDMRLIFFFLTISNCHEKGKNRAHDSSIFLFSDVKVSKIREKLSENFHENA